MNTGKSKISVIVPIYNVEPYLRRCIDSILAQTHVDFELILVDDGSPDHCAAICDEYAMRDDRIVVIHQKNCGVGVARNAGIDWVFANSNSQWITFVDSDDCIRPQMLEHLLKAATSSGVLLSLCMLAVFTQEINLDTSFPDKLDIQIFSGKEVCKSLYLNERIFCTAPHSKMYHRDLFNEFRFPVGKIHEDQSLIPRLLYSAGLVAAVFNPYYCYFTRAGSIMNEGFSIRRFDNVDALNTCIQFYESNGEDELAQLATKVRDRAWSDCVLASWKRGLWRDIPQQHRPTFFQSCSILAKGVCRKIKTIGKKRKATKCKSAK